MERERLGRGGVIALTGVGMPERMTHVAQLRHYWNAIRGEARVARRDDVDPRKIAQILPDAFVIERIAPATARFRIAGENLNLLMGMAVAGMPFAALFALAAREALREPLEALFSGPEIVEMAVTAERGFGRPPLSGRMILLPLADHTGAVTRAIGCLACEGAVGRAPRRLAIGQLTRNLLTEGPDEGSQFAAPPQRPAGTGPGASGDAGARDVAAGGSRASAPPAAPGPVPAEAGFAESPADFAPPRRGAHLRLVKSDESAGPGAPAKDTAEDAADGQGPKGRDATDDDAHGKPAGTGPAGTDGTAPQKAPRRTGDEDDRS